MDTAQPNPTPKKRWPRWAKAFLKCFAAYGVVGYAAKRAKIDRSTVYDLRKADGTFEAAFQLAYDEAIDAAESEAWRRAIKGCRKPVTVAGEKVFIREYSDTLLIFMLKAARPTTYRENRRVEHTGDGGGPMRVVNVYLPDNGRGVK